MYVSEKWTDRERLRVVSRIAVQILEIAVKESNAELIDIEERLGVLASETSLFLEENRERVLKGIDD